MCFGDHIGGDISLLKINFDKQFFVALIVVVLAGIILRTIGIGSIPSGMTWDEAAIGYNGFAIWQTHRDEWLELMPVSFRSFGDYKAPLAIYINGLFTTLFGLKLWVVRLPFVLASWLTIIGMILMVWLLIKAEIIQFNRLSTRIVVLITAVLISFSPWHILFSRVGFESGLALCQLVWAANLWLIFIILVNNKFFWARSALIGSVAVLASSFYTYHSAKVVAPILLAGTLLWTTKNRPQTRKILAMALTFLVLLLLPFLDDSIFGQGLTRAGVTVFSNYSPVIAVLLAVKNLVLHLLPGFLIWGNTDSLRHSTGLLGVLYPTEYVILMIGVFSQFLNFLRKKINFLKKQAQAQINQRHGLVFGLVWLLAGLLPAAIGNEVPHPNRALLSLPGMLIMILFGLDISLGWLKRRSKKFSRSVIALVLVAQLMFISAFFVQYFGPYQARSSEEFLVGYLEVFELIWQYHDGTDGKPEVDQIVMTNQYGQPYIYALFSRQISPIAYHNGALVKFLFEDSPDINDLSRNNALIVTGPEAVGLDDSQAETIINDHSGNVRFRLFYSGVKE